MSDKEAREIIGTRDALTLENDLAARRVTPDEAVIRELHRRVLWNQSSLLTPGEYRRGENGVLDADGSPIFRTPPSGDVPDLMHEFAAWLATATKRHAPPVVAALAHLEFVAIHPFHDGNGRTAHAIARLILVRHGFALGGRARSTLSSTSIDPHISPPSGRRLVRTLSLAMTRRLSPATS